MKKKWVIILVVLGILVVVNLGVLNWRMIRGEGGLCVMSRVVRMGNEEETAGAVNEKNASLSCESACQEIIGIKIKEELEKFPALAGQSSISPSAAPKQQVVVMPTNEKPKIAYIPLVADGSGSSTEWTDIIPSEFYFNLSDYPNVKEVRFESYLSSVNNDQVFARLYDVTNKRGVDYSDLLTSNSAFTRIESNAIKIWAGNNKYTVQLRSVNGTKVQIKDAKLKILY